MASLDVINGDAPPSEDPLQLLRTMAERVGGEVESFAAELDTWANDKEKTQYQATVELVGECRNIAKERVETLRKDYDAENKRELADSTAHRVNDMADAPMAGEHDIFGQSSQSTALHRQSSAARLSDELHQLRQWQAELATWDLVRIVIEQHYPDPESDPAKAKRERLAEAGGTKQYSKNSEIWDRFLLEDDRAKEKALVLRWLEQTARNDRSDLPSITTELERQSGRGAHTWTSGWLDTKGRIKQAKRLEAAQTTIKPDSVKLMTADGTHNLVTQLDPDAPARQSRHLERPDDFYERALWMVCYEMLRRGMPWDQICDWAQHRNEAWRGVSVGAACEAHPDGGPNLSGPTVGYMFRRMCFYAARGAQSPYEGAVYGLLSGDVKLAQAACRTWDDHLHAHYNALLLSRFDSYLQQEHAGCRARVTQNLAQKFVFQDAVAKLGDWQHASRNVVDALKQQKSTAAEATEPFKLIQGALIAGNVHELVLMVGIAIADMFATDERPNNLMLHPDSQVTARGPKPESNKRTFLAEPHHQALATDSHALRVLVHIFIVFRNGLHCGPMVELTRDSRTWMATDNVIVAYIELLRVAKKYMVIPAYAAQLSDDRIVHCLARVLPDIKNGDEQRSYINVFKRCNVDMTDSIVESILFAQNNAGLTRFDENMHSQIINPISHFKILEPAPPDKLSPWPGYRIRQGFAGTAIGAEEDAIIEALQWLQYAANDYEKTFEKLRYSLMIFLLKGRLAAAETVINELSVESISLSRTEAIFGYPFDFTHPDAMEKDEKALYEHRKTLDAKDRIPVENLPEPDHHAAIVHDLRVESAGYFELQLIVRILVLFREWRDEEAIVENYNFDKAQKASPDVPKPDLTTIKDLLESIEAVFHTLISSITISLTTSSSSDHTFHLRCAYMPEIVLAYLAVLHSAATFLKPETAAILVVKAMEIANLVADEEHGWLQQVFVDTKRMRELVDALARVSMFMLKLGEVEPKKSVVKKRGSKGETIRIWDLNAKDRL